MQKVTLSVLEAHRKVNLLNLEIQALQTGALEAEQAYDKIRFTPRQWRQAENLATFIRKTSISINSLVSIRNSALSSLKAAQAQAAQTTLNL